MKVYLVEYNTGGLGTTRKPLSEYAPHLYRFETEEGAPLRLIEGSPHPQVHEAWIHRLSNGLGVEFDCNDMILLDTRTYSPKQIAILTAKVLSKLFKLYTDGCCSICLDEIPQGNTICDSCFLQAQQRRR